MCYGLEKVTSPNTPIYKQLLEYYEFCEKVRGFTKKTMETKTAEINRFAKYSGLEDLKEVSNDDVFRFVAMLKDHNNTGRSINNYTYQIQSMLKWQRDDGLEMPKLKLSRIVLQKEKAARKNWFTRQQIELALLYAKPREWLMIALSFDCGLRIEEMVSLRVEQIKGRKIKIVGKGGKLRWVMMSKKTLRRLKVYLEREGIKDWLWPSRQSAGEHIRQDSARNMMAAVFKKAGFNNFRPHDLRHSFATELKLMGLPTRRIQLAMGHTTEGITEKYLSDLEGVTIEDICKDLRFSFVKVKAKSLVANVLYILPRIRIDHSASKR